MSSAWAKGSTRSWRQLRWFILERDNHRCMVPLVPDSITSRGIHGIEVTRVCGRHADTAGHIVAKVNGGQDKPTNLRAECRAHNYSDGGRLAHAVRATIRRWSW